jgi:bifunctional DNase/RNase
VSLDDRSLKLDQEYVPVKLAGVGHIDDSGAEGVVNLVSLADERDRLVMRAFSGEVATHIARFIQGDRSSIPTIYNIIEEFAERGGLQLVNVKLYGSGAAIRGDISFRGHEKKTLVLQGYRASDCVALAAFYDAPILVEKTLLTRYLA